MKNVIVKSSCVALFAAAASVAIVLVINDLAGVAVDTRSLSLATLCPLLIAWPLSYVAYRRKGWLAETLEKLSRSHAELARTHAALAAAHVRLAEKARHDGMTGMLNRAGFFEALRNGGRREGGVLMIIDADRFKEINDNFGHLAGDEALLMIAAAIRKGVRTRDIVGRIGGEEFAVFVPAAEETEARGIAERIRRNVEEIEFSPSKAGLLPLSVSIGGALQRPGADVPDLMREADRQLYAAKKAGRNRVSFITFSEAA